LNRIFSAQFHAAEGAEAWRVLPEGAYAFYRTDSFARSARFVEAISRLRPEGRGPAIDIRVDGVTVLIGALRPRGTASRRRIWTSRGRFRRPQASSG
jgi:hypothetical protein